MSKKTLRCGICKHCSFKFYSNFCKQRYIFFYLYFFFIQLRYSCATAFDYNILLIIHISKMNTSEYFLFACTFIKVTTMIFKCFCAKCFSKLGFWHLWETFHKNIGWKDKKRKREKKILQHHAHVVQNVFRDESRRLSVWIMLCKVTGSACASGSA